MNYLQRDQLVIIRIVDRGDEEQGGVAAVDDFGVCESGGRHRGGWGAGGRQGRRGEEGQVSLMCEVGSFDGSG